MWSHDVRYAVRLLASNPSFTLIALLTLALGIGANTAVFSVIDTVLLRPPPLRDPGSLAVIWETDRNTGTRREPASLPDFLDYRERATRIEQLAAFMASEVNFNPDRGEAIRFQALEVTHELLPMLGAIPALGRVFTAEETSPGGAAVILLSDALWTRVYARDPAVLGRIVRLDDELFTVVGIMPPEADFGVFQILTAADYARGFADRGGRAAVDVWLPLRYDVRQLPRETHPLFMMGRLRSDVASAQQEFGAIAAHLERTYPENAARGVHVEPFASIVFGPARDALLVLLAAVGLVLLVACANVANLLLARGSVRRKEVAIRTALGASGSRLARQFVVEGVLLTCAAAVVGLAVAAGGVRALVALAPADIPRITEAGVDLRVLAATLAISVLAGLVFGMVPLLQARQIDLQSSLKTGGGHGSSAGHRSGRAQSALVVAEFALAVMLVIGAALLIRSFWSLQQVDPGFRADGILKAEYQLPPSRYPADFSKWPNFQEMHAFSSGVLERVSALPGVESAALAGNHPLDPGFTNSFRVVGREAEARTWPEISVRRVTETYFRTMAVPLVRGRLFQASDGTDAPPVVVINEAAARRFFRNHEPLGKQISFWGSARTVIGVVGDERFRGLAEAPPPAVYAPLAQAPSADGAGVLLVRAANPTSVASGVRDAIRQQDPALAVFGLEPLSETISRSVGERRFTMLVLAVLATVVLALAAVGIHGVLSYRVSQRTREIGIRVALGAHPARVHRQVVAEAVMLSATGAVVGLAGAALLTRWLSSLLFAVTPTDPVTFIGVPGLLIVVAFAASYFPARRATRIDPVAALRGE